MTETAPQICQRLEHCYTEIEQQRMQDVPVLNRLLQVKAIGFEPWRGYQLGVIMSPWMMNIMLLPGEASLDSMRCGEKTHINLPSGDYEFVRGEESSIGPYLSCSLFSPVFEFEQQSVFEQTGTAALEALMEPANREQLGFEEWPEPPPAEGDEAEAESNEQAAVMATSEEAPPSPAAMDRRGFLRRLRRTDQPGADRANTEEAGHAS